MTKIELNQERAANICADLSQGYFSNSSPELLQCYADDARVKNDIVFDYLARIEEGLQKLRQLME